MSDIKELFNIVKESGKFNFIIPKGCDRIYGKAKHNMPHEFYAEFKNSDIVLNARFNEKPVWIRYLTSIKEVISIQSARAREKAHKEWWPYSDSFPIKSLEITTEDILLSDRTELKEFIIFNINLFV